MATGLDFYERREEYIGVSVSNPAVGADVARALTAAYKRYEEYHGKSATDDATPDYTPTRDDFERKLIQGIHDDAWEARITAFGIHGGERGYRLVPVDQAVNPDRGEPVTVFTASGLAEVERAAAARGWDEGLAAAIEAAIKDDGYGNIQYPANPYRRNEGENE